MNALLVFALWQTPPAGSSAEAPAKAEPTYPVNLTIDGVSCDGCVETIRQSLARLRGARDVSAKLVDRAKKTGAASLALPVSTPVNYDLLKKALRGYNLKSVEVELRGAAAFKTSEQGDFTAEASGQVLAVIRRPGDVEDKPFDDFKKTVGKSETKLTLKGELVVHKNALALHVTGFKVD